MAVFARSTPYRRRLLTTIFVFGCAALLGRAPAAEPERDGLFITVPNPITDNAFLKIEQRVRDAVERQGRTVGVVVFAFNPQGKPAGTSNVFPCMQLNDYINRLSLGQLPKLPNVQTVAYIQEETTDHTVLPVLACREIVMSSKGQIGHVMRNQDVSLPKEAKQAYEEAFQVKRLPGLMPKLMAGSRNSAILDLQEAQKAGLCQARVETRPGVKDLYGLPALSLREDALEDRVPVVWRIEIRGAIDQGKLNSLERRIKGAIRKKANVIILHLDCDGGETVDAAAMAERLRNLTDEGGVLPIKTIAYVPKGRSLGAATFLALGCSEIVMDPDARLGGFDYLKGGSPDDLAAKKTMLVELAKAQGYHPGFFHAMLDSKPAVDVYRHPTRKGASAVVTEADLTDEKADWKRETGVLPAERSELYSLDSQTARKYGIVRHSDITSPNVLYERYGFDATKVETSRDDWLDAVAAFIRSPLVNILLIMVGVAGLILELKVPGFGIPGIVAAICFVLFFWAHAFAGQSTWEFTLLAVLLFLLGLAMLAVELFVLPGFGVTGISGIVLIVVSLVLVMLEQMPATSQEWGNLGTALGTVGLGMVAGLGAAICIARYLPNIPYASKLVLEPPEENGQMADGDRTQEGLAAAALLGAVGVATTTLRPAGKAQFDEQFLDVIAEGDYVNAGSRVQVIEIEGNRIVVKAI